MDDEGAAFRYRRFLCDVRGLCQMWGLAAGSEWASATLKTHPGRQTYYFWSKRGYAAPWARDDWKDCTPRSIHLVQFLNASADEMRRRGCLIAPNWIPGEGGHVIEFDRFHDDLSSRAGDWDIFISYAREEQDGVALPLCRALRRLGMMVWFDLKDMPTFLTPTDAQLPPMLSGAMRRALGFVLVLSPSFLPKPWPLHELEHLLGICRARDAQVCLVWHGMKPDLHLEPIAALRAAARALTSFESGSDVELIARQIAVQHPPLPRLRLERYDGVTSVGIDRDAGKITVRNVPEGMDIPDPSIHEFEMSGHQLDFRGLLKSVEMGMTLEQLPGTLPDRWFEWRGRGSLAYVQVNRPLCTEDEIREGVLLNLPARGMDLPFKPVFVSPGATVGIMNDAAWEELQSLLARAEPAARSSWRRIVRRAGRIAVADDPHPDEPRLTQIG